jgi:hypothetical protein
MNYKSLWKYLRVFGRTVLIVEFAGWEVYECVCRPTEMYI